MSLKDNYIKNTHTMCVFFLSCVLCMCMSVNAQEHKNLTWCLKSVCVCCCYACVLPCVLTAGCGVHHYIIHQQALSDGVLVLRLYGSHVNRCAYKGFNHWLLGNNRQETITAVHAETPLKEMSRLFYLEEIPLFDMIGVFLWNVIFSHLWNNFAGGRSRLC